MNEIYENIPDSVRDKAKLVFSLAMAQKDIMRAVELLNNYTELAENEEEQDFLRFYFNLRMEQILNE